MLNTPQLNSSSELWPGFSRLSNVTRVVVMRNTHAQKYRKSRSKKYWDQYNWFTFKCINHYANVRWLGFEHQRTRHIWECYAQELFFSHFWVVQVQFHLKKMNDFCKLTIYKFFILMKWFYVSVPENRPKFSQWIKA